MEKEKTKNKGEFKMLAVHSKVPFVMSLEHQKNHRDRDKKNCSNFLEKMKKIEEQKNRGVGTTDNKR